MTRVGLILNGCGFKDGSEIHESVIAMLALEEAGADVVCLAPHKPQSKVVNHQKLEDAGGQRIMIEEAARIARGDIKELSKVTPSDFDAVVIPGGFGTALNLCDFALKGEDMSVDPDTERLLRGMHAAKKPIGAICIAPVILAKIFGADHAEITIGNDQDMATKLEKLGVRHVDCRVDECVVDSQNRLVTTPAYMLGERVKDIHRGIRTLADTVVRMAQERH